MALDRFGRNLHYLRISLTDHCNLRCVYCMPEDMTFKPNADLMQDDELRMLVQLFATLGFDKIRLTGGEPTVRNNIVQIVRDITATPGIRSVSMTTNGVLLNKLAQPLAAAGLERVNISVDTLNPQKFRRITRWGNFEQVWEGIQASEAAGLTPIKINAVIVRGFNDDDIPQLAALTLQHAWQVRFIEMMPFAGATELQTNQTVRAAEMRTQIQAQFGALTLLNDGELDGEAQLYQIPGAIGTLGFISSISAPFCAACNRVRLTADGKLRLCLLREGEIDLLTPLRAGETLPQLRQRIVDGLWLKPWGHGLADGVIPLNRVMSEIGG
ncbi:MAG: GTP 3',8-cyclase MoaA [Anaerolineales bacterium]